MARTIEPKRLLLTLLVIALIIVASFAGYWFWKNVLSKKTVSMNDQPAYLYSIYGNEAKPLKSPMFVFESAQGKIYVSSTGNNEVQVFDSNGKYDFSFGQPGSNPGDLSFPYGIAQIANGNILVAETGNARIQEFSRDGKYVGLLASTDAPLQVSKPGALFSLKDKLYICDLNLNQISVVDLKAKSIINTFKGFSYPHGVWSDSAGKLFISDAGGQQIAILNPEGTQSGSIAWQEGNELSVIRGVALDKLGRIFVVDSGKSIVRVFDQAGKELYQFGKPGFDNQSFLYPAGIYIGKKNRIYVADWANNRVQVWGY